MRVIGIFGQCQMGKDTLGDHLVTKLDKGWKRVNFALEVKQLYCRIFGVDMEFIEKWKVIPEAPPGFLMPVRQGLQFIGDGFRKIKENIWIEKTFENNNSFIASDGRYINEFTHIRKRRGLNILIAKEDKLNDDPNGSEAQIKPYVLWALNNLTDCKSIKSELWGRSDCFKSKPPPYMEYFDFFVNNNSTKEDLLRKVERFVVPFVNNFIFG